MATFSPQAVLSWHANPQSHQRAQCANASATIAAAPSRARGARPRVRESVTCSAQDTSRAEPSLASSSNATSSSDASLSMRRRGMLLGGLLQPIITGAAAAPGALADEPRGFRKLDSGLLVADIFDGSASAASAASARGAGLRVAEEGSTVAIHYTGRLAAKQGWVFDSTREPGNSADEGEPFVFKVGDPSVIRGLSEAVKGLRVGAVRRVVVPPPLGFQSEGDKPVPKEFWQRRRLYSTVFNPTRIGNGEGDTLGTLVFDIEVVQIR